MKYIIMLYGSQQDYDGMAGRSGDGPAMTAEEVSAMHEYMGELHEELQDSGELVEANGLAAPALAQRVRLRDGAPAVTDGPYPETQEVLAGYTIVDVDGVDRAIELAARFVNPDAEEEYVDVRPVIEGMDDLAV